MIERLDIWLYGTRAATIEEDADQRIGLRWDQQALDRWGEGARLLSAKLPTGISVPASLVKNYLDGLLPEGNARVNYALSAGLAPDDTFGLIRFYGRDTPGAAIFVEHGAEDPTRDGRYKPIPPLEVAERLQNADAHSPAASHSLIGESSTLPGMVPKITLHREADQWFACKDGAPSTWIIKRGAPLDSGIGDIIDTEAACLAIARRVGLTTIDAEVLTLGEHRAIAVSRYDRSASTADDRLHQEDLAQAIGLNTADPDRKFQYGSRMPSLAHGADVLRLDGGNPDALLQLATFSHLVGNTDMHAKNISFIRHSDGRVSLAPAYDVAMHLHHPRDNRRSALDVNSKFWMADIDVEDLVAEGTSWGLPERRSRRIVIDTAERLAQALEEITRDEHPGVPSAAWATVDERVARAVRTHAGTHQPARSRTGRRGPRRPG